ncbi:hypothetical protein SAMN06265795_12620 [Noviherbaspirillum humi]|uniref:Uncharacterized protein n=1 Tax=Noviherbaspirillum humi TaxID=1688639 RepID=A0A239LSP8_9BURK|nr:hypothetical protein SAMN06265795_12620 [Noviherbaspirillum humi]
MSVRISTALHGQISRDEIGKLNIFLDDSGSCFPYFAVHEFYVCSERFEIVEEAIFTTEIISIERFNLFDSALNDLSHFYNLKCDIEIRNSLDVECREHFMDVRQADYLSSPICRSVAQARFLRGFTFSIFPCMLDQFLGFICKGEKHVHLLLESGHFFNLLLLPSLTDSDTSKIESASNSPNGPDCLNPGCPICRFKFAPVHPFIRADTCNSYQNDYGISVVPSIHFHSNFWTKPSVTIWHMTVYQKPGEISPGKLSSKSKRPHYSDNHSKGARAKQRCATDYADYYPCPPPVEPTVFSDIHHSFYRLEERNEHGQNCAHKKASECPKNRVFDSDKMIVLDECLSKAKECSNATAVEHCQSFSCFKHRCVDSSLSFTKSFGLFPYLLQRQIIQFSFKFFFIFHWNLTTFVHLNFENTTKSTYLA